jgi:hypothetical protein
MRIAAPPVVFSWLSVAGASGRSGEGAERSADGSAPATGYQSVRSHHRICLVRRSRPGRLRCGDMTRATATPAGRCRSAPGILHDLARRWHDSEPPP